jgi:ribose transport system substrate-binding protein
MRIKASIKKWQTTLAASLLGFCISVILIAGCQRGLNDSTSDRVIQAGKYTILDTRTDLTDRARAKQNVEDALISYPEIAGLVGLWAYNGPAMLSAVLDAGMESRVQIISFDEEEDVLQGIIDGHVYGTVVQQPYEFGYHSVRILAALARGEEGVLPEDGIYEIPVMQIRRDNVEEFWAELRERIAGAGDAPPAPPEGQDVVEVGFISNNVADFWRIARAGVRKAEGDFNVRCEFQMPHDGTPAEQQRILEALMTRGVSGVAISVNDPENQLDLINRACEVMNVITQDNDAPDSNRLCYVGSNNYMAGRKAGQLVKEALPDGGQIMIFVGRMDAQNAIERRQGVIDELMEE